MDGIHSVSAASRWFKWCMDGINSVSAASGGLSDVWMVFTLYQQAVDGDHFSIN